MAPDADIERLVKPVLSWLMEEVRADPRFAGKSPAEILDYCAKDILTLARRMSRADDGAKSGGHSKIGW